MRSLLHNDRRARGRSVDSQAGDAVALFLGLYLGHILGDFVFQPGRLVVAKRRDPRAAVLHALIVTLCTAGAVAAALPQVWSAVLLAGAAHLIVERITIRIRHRPGASSLAVFLLDQGLHMLLLAGVAMLPWPSISPVAGPWAVSMTSLAAICGVSTVAFAGSILIFEIRLSRTERSLSRGAEDPDPVLGFDGPRVYGITERGTALAIALLAPVPAFGLLPFVPRLAYAIASPSGRRSEQLLAAATGVALCAAAWLLVYFVGSTR